MSKIPYFFRAIPEEFLTDEFIDDPIMMKLIRFIMKRITPNPSTFTFKNNGKIRKVDLQPFEFVFGREACSKETGISEKKVRTKLGQLIGLSFVSRSASRSASTFTVYRLMTESFKQNTGQQICQQMGQQMGQQIGHKLETKKQRKKDFVVVPEKIGEGVEVMNNSQITKDDVYLFCLKRQKDWTPQEMDKAWLAYQKAENVEHPMNYIEGIIKKIRTLKTCKEKKLCKKIPLNPQETEKKKSLKDSGFYAANDTSERPLAKFDRQYGLKKQCQIL